jgi:hypothetical protein
MPRSNDNNAVAILQLSIPLLGVIDSDKSLGNELKNLRFLTIYLRSLIRT